VSRRGPVFELLLLLKIALYTKYAFCIIIATFDFNAIYYTGIEKDFGADV
jgi:hypothetical protein